MPRLSRFEAMQCWGWAIPVLVPAAAQFTRHAGQDGCSSCRVCGMLVPRRAVQSFCMLHQPRGLLCVGNWCVSLGHRFCVGTVFCAALPCEVPAVAWCSWKQIWHCANPLLSLMMLQGFSPLTCKYISSPCKPPIQGVLSLFPRDPGWGL